MKSQSNSLLRSTARPYRPVAARSVRTEARLFKIRSLHSEHATVVLDDPPTAESATPVPSPATSTPAGADSPMDSPLAVATTGTSAGRLPGC
jgi:hypothetical protein